MRKSLLLGMTLALMSNSAFATKARLLALGMDETDNEGSYYIDDNRNIFLNAGNIVNHSNLAIFEWGSAGQNSNATRTPPSAGTSDNTTDQDSSPQAEGGFLKTSDNYTYGIFLGAESNTSALLKVVASSENSPTKLLNSSDNQIDLFFGTRVNDIAVGADLVYIKGKDETINEKSSGLALKVGAVASTWQSFVNLSLKSNSKEDYSVGSTHEFDGNFGIHTGGSYNIGNGRVYGYVKHFSWDQKDSAPTTVGRKETAEGSFTSYSLGYGHTSEISSNARVFSSIEYRVKTIEADFGVASTGATGAKTEAENRWIPITVGYETVATNWLTLRGSVVSNVIGTKDNKNYKNLNATAQGFATQEFGAQGKSTLANSTNVKTGATLNFGKLKVDGVIGTTTSGTLSLDNVMSRVGVSYWF